MKRLLVALSLLTIPISGIAQSCCQPDNYSFYIKVGSGASCSECANIIAPYPPWNPAAQGYDSTLGNCPIAGLSIGCELLRTVDLEASISNRSIFKYRKFQTPTTGSASYIA